MEPWEDKIKRLRALTIEPKRMAMTRHQRFPTMAAKHIANEKEIVTLRNALREAVGMLELMGDPVSNA